MVWYFIKQVFLSYKEHYMVAWRYEISLLVLKKIIHSFAALTHEIFFNTRREVSYPRARPCSILYFCYRREQSCREHAKWFCKYVANFPHFVLNSIFICRWQPSSGKARYLLIKLQLKSYSIYHNFLTPLLVKGIFFFWLLRGLRWHVSGKVTVHVTYWPVWEIQATESRNWVYAVMRNL